MKVLIAPDSFKGSLTSVQVARAVAEGWARVRPGDEIVLCPLADGGEGTLEAVAAAGGFGPGRDAAKLALSGVRTGAALVRQVAAAVALDDGGSTGADGAAGLALERLAQIAEEELDADA